MLNAPGYAKKLCCPEILSCTPGRNIGATWTLCGQQHDREMEHEHRQETKGSISGFKAVLSTYHIHHNTCYMLILSANMWVEKKTVGKNLQAMLCGQ